MNSDNNIQDYLQSKVGWKSSARSTRSTLGPLCEVPKSYIKTVGDRSFICAIPNLWNQLPLSIRSNELFNSFKSELKT